MTKECTLLSSVRGMFAKICHIYWVIKQTSSLRSWKSYREYYLTTMDYATIRLSMNTPNICKLNTHTNNK